MVAATLVRPKPQFLLVRRLALGLLVGACFASVRHAQAQNSALDYYNQGSSFDKRREYDRAIAAYNQAITLNPNYIQAYNNRGNAWGKKGEYDRAIADFNQAIRLDPRYASAYCNRGAAWNGKKEYDRAIADFNQAIGLDPNFALAYQNRACAWNGKKEYNRAIADFNQAIGLDPKYALAYSNLAWVQATCPDARFRDGDKALENARQAYRLDGGDNASYIDTLAAAAAEKGYFQAAREWQARAIERLKNEKDKEDYLARLKLYEKRKPYRQEP